MSPHVLRHSEAMQLRGRYPAALHPRHPRTRRPVQHRDLRPRLHRGQAQGPRSRLHRDRHRRRSARDLGPGPTSGSRRGREMPVWARRAASERGRNAGGLPLVIQPLQLVPEDAVAAKCVVVPQDATRLNQGHCGSPEDNPVFMLPASAPASPNPEGSAPRGNPILVPRMYHDGAAAGLVSGDGDWVAHPVDPQGERLLMERTAANARLLTTNSLPCPRCSSGQPDRKRPRPKTSALA